MTAVGIMEMNSIARGYETADEMVKTAEVDLLFARPVCPGKFIIITGGTVAEVSAALDSGKSRAGPYLLDDLLLPNIHPLILPAFYGVPESVPLEAVGIIETFTAPSAVEAADAGVKAAAVTLVELRLSLGLAGKSFAVFSGSVSPVKAAVEAGCAPVKKKGYLVESSVIPHPDEKIRRLLLT